MLQASRSLAGLLLACTPYRLTLYRCLLQDLPTSSGCGLAAAVSCHGSCRSRPPHGLMRSSCLTLPWCLLQDSAMDIFQVQSKLDVEHKLPVTGARNGTYMHRWDYNARLQLRQSGHSTAA